MGICIFAWYRLTVCHKNGLDWDSGDFRSRARLAAAGDAGLPSQRSGNQGVVAYVMATAFTLGYSELSVAVTNKRPGSVPEKTYADLCLILHLSFGEVYVFLCIFVFSPRHFVFF